jgi:hypothetical protein
MSAQWDHQFCLGCDKQVHVDSDAYCSESCRLADLERPSFPASSSQASSPGLAPSSWSSSPSRPSSHTKFYLSPAYDFSNAQPYGTTPATSTSFLDAFAAGRSERASSPCRAHGRQLSPSSSHSSLCSMQSTSSTTEASQLSDKARKELRAYAVSFEQVRLQRRRSY